MTMRVNSYDSGLRRNDFIFYDFFDRPFRIFYSLYQTHLPRHHHPLPRRINKFDAIKINARGNVAPGIVQAVPEDRMGAGQFLLLHQHPHQAAGDIVDF